MEFVRRDESRGDNPVRRNQTDVTVQTKAPELPPTLMTTKSVRIGKKIVISDLQEKTVSPKASPEEETVGMIVLK